MKAWLFSIAGALLLATVGYGGYLAGAGNQAVLDAKEIARGRKAVADLSAEVERLNRQVGALPKAVATEKQDIPPALKDQDHLRKMFNATDDKGVGGIGFDLEGQPGSHDYKAVVEAFVETRLQKEMRSMITVSRSVNPRVVLVTTADGAALEISMKKWNNRGQIWSVTGYNELHLQGEPASDGRYRVLQVADAPADVQEWAGKWEAKSEWAKESLPRGEKTYLLLKTSDSPTDSVEVEEIRFGAEELFVTYQTFEYGETADPALINDRLLIEVDHNAAQGVTFHESYHVGE